MKNIFLKNGIHLKWLNTAGFEIIMSNGKHILLDPFLTGNINGLSCWPVDLDVIESCDYLLLSHIHFDHAADVEKIQKKFPNLKLFVGDLSADPLCEFQELDCSKVYRVRSGEKYQFDDLRIEVFAGRHTESSKGMYRKKTLNKDGSFDAAMWYGSLELQNYLLTLCDGTRILVWAGMTSEDQMHRFAGLTPDIALMHISPKQSFDEFSRLTKAINPKVIIPHHYDCTEVLFQAVPEAMNQMSEENRRKFVVNGQFQFPLYLKALGDACQEKNPASELLLLEHHRWYRFGFCWGKEN